MRFGILGPMQVRAADGTLIAVGGPRPRALLALLLLDTGHVISTDRLIDELYGGHPPKEAANALQAQVSRLRKKLGNDIIELHPGGYRIKVDPNDIDLYRFTKLAEEGRNSLERGEHSSAAEQLEQALGLWRGPTDIPWLEEARLNAIEDHAEAQLAQGKPPIAELQQLTTSYPLRERLQSLFMRALQQQGRQAEALTVFENTRKTLADELGVDP